MAKRKPSRNQRDSKVSRSERNRGQNTNENRDEMSNSSGNRRSDGCNYGDASRGANDVSWYTRYPNLVEGSAKIPFPYKPGMSVPLTPTGVTPVQSEEIPGIIVIPWAPYPGRSDSPTDPASLVAKGVYARVRSKFSSSLDVDAPDFVMYLMALDSVFTYCGWLKRIYRSINAFTPENYQLPNTLLMSYGLYQDQIEFLRIKHIHLTIHGLSIHVNIVCQPVVPIENIHNSRTSKFSGH